MSEEVTPSVETEDTDLDQFADEFFGQSEPAPEPTNSETEVEEAPEEVDAPNDTSENDDDSGEVDAPATEEETDEDEGGKPEPKKNTAQDRINELTGKYREEERKRLALEDRLRKLEESQNSTQDEKTETAETEETGGMPSIDDKTEDGKVKYPLGEFDPKYISDLVEYRVSTALTQAEKTREQETKQKEVTTARAELQQDWDSRLATAVQEKPDYVEKTQQLVESLGEIGDDYGEYIATTLMSLDNGTDVLYHLANNPDQAQEIVNGGATKATLALGRLSAELGTPEPTETKAPKSSNAPVPPPVNKGSSVAKPKVSPDTDDLDSFEKIFFKD